VVIRGGETVRSKLAKIVRQKLKTNFFKGVIFDLDGVIVKSSLDFGLIAKEIFGSASKRPVLERIEELSHAAEREEAFRILEKHEKRAALGAQLNPGIDELLELVKRRGMKTAIVTRNTQDLVRIILEKFHLHIDCIVTREAASPKPSKEPVLRACGCMGLSPYEVVFLGDYEFDMLAGERAGVVTILLRSSKESTSKNADLEIDSIAELVEIFS
jgi:HAD superfamily hydrolase (TIGR01509 family)